MARRRLELLEATFLGLLATVVLGLALVGTGTGIPIGSTPSAPDAPASPEPGPATDERPAPAAFLPGEEAPSCGVPVPDRMGPRRPHPPVRVDGSDPEESPTVATAPGVDQPVYRPGSGIVAGNGTAEDPYIVAGWRLPRLMIQHTDAHFVVADNRFDPRREPTGRTVDRPDRLGLLPGHYVEKRGVDTTRIVDATNVSVVRNVGDQQVLVADSPGVCLGNNTLSPFVEGEGAVFCASPDVRVVGNEGLRGLSLVGSPHAEVRRNAFSQRGVVIGFLTCTNPFEDADLGIRPAYFDHTIPPTNTVDGDPVLYRKGIADATVDDPVGQVLLHNATNVSVEGLELGRNEVSYSWRVSFRNVSVNGTGNALGDTLLGVRSSNLTVRDSSFDGTILDYVDSPDLTFVGNVVDPVGDDALTLTRSPRGRVADNTVKPIADGVSVYASPDTTVVDNRIKHPQDGVDVYKSDDVLVEGNEVTKFSTGVDVTLSSDVRVVGNVLTDSAGFGVWTHRTSGINVSHNRIVGAETNDLKTGIGLDADGDAPPETVWANDIVLAEEGIAVGGSDWPVKLRRNNIGDQVIYGVANRDDVPAVDATDNWWGCPDGPTAEACSDAAGEVLFDPWLEEPNPEAGPPAP
jgi:hypothetical protein